ncbi:MAG: DUF4936 family protein [Pseudomonadota bacterium]
MQPGSRRLFIYYRLAEADLPAACAAVRQAQQALCARHAGLVAGLLQAPAPSAAGERTVMETYVMDAQVNAQGVDAALQAAVEATLCAALKPWLAHRQRHLEVFVDLPCAS